jgi:hypothetical protein
MLFLLLCVAAFAAGWTLHHLLSPSESVRFVNGSDRDAVLGYVIQEQGTGAAQRACFRLRPGASLTHSLDLHSLPHVLFFASDGDTEYVLEDYIFFPAAPENLIVRQRSTLLYTGAEFTKTDGKRSYGGVASKSGSVDMTCRFQADNPARDR